MILKNIIVNENKIIRKPKAFNAMRKEYLGITGNFISKYIWLDNLHKRINNKSSNKNIL